MAENEKTGTRLKEGVPVFCNMEFIRVVYVLLKIV